MTTISTLIAAIIGSVGAYFAWRSSKSRQRSDAEQAVAAENAANQARKAEIEHAVYSQDDDEVNSILSQLLVLCGGVIAAVLLGCSTATPTTVYIPTDRKIESCTNSLGFACKAVPDPVFADMLLKLQELKDLQNAAKVDARLN